MSSDAQEKKYQLIDFGRGRKLERFGSVLLDRVSPAADGLEQRQRSQWKLADARVDERGQIECGKRPGNRWQIEVSGISFLLDLTPFGHVGIFPEQQSNWDWLQKLQARHARKTTGCSALNLFAYTGGATLALAKAGFRVTHVDASAPSVRWARDNALLNNLQEHPVRWIVEDARRYADRELKRGERYDAIVLDPPSFGHGPTGKRWDIEVGLFPLLQSCLKLLRDSDSVLLLTGHSPSPSVAEIVAWFEDQTQGAGQLDSQRLTLIDLSGRPLDCGYSLRLSNVV